ncbi:hypothetical protein GCM10009555_087140 [Acrocarpospora macrocephala]|uniref:Resuscitation-promoting factor core lysozyme-like domain-containing protein n=1 Tax=Acrocarpospora macrocephala TaxID=150177 RepID=A0A5M3WLE1_9ACTN|nr:hypothetical protein [Acrocarpospora macrocephala]GES08852.1 hypothetical protein Amac_024480 [Acrocarpospora macrocephala]
MRDVRATIGCAIVVTAALWPVSSSEASTDSTSAKVITSMTAAPGTDPPSPYQEGYAEGTRNGMAAAEQDAWQRCQFDVNKGYALAYADKEGAWWVGYRAGYGSGYSQGYETSSKKHCVP